MAGTVVGEVNDNDNWDDVYGDSQPQTTAEPSSDQGETRSDLVNDPAARAVQAEQTPPLLQKSEANATDGSPTGPQVPQGTSVNRVDRNIPGLSMPESDKDSQPSTAHTGGLVLDPAAPPPEKQPVDMSDIARLEPVFAQATLAKPGQAEFEFSDSDSDSDSDSSDTTSDGSEIATLDMDTINQLLMAGDYDESSESKGQMSEDRTFGHRTANEKVEKAPPRPDVIITPEMTVQSLGTIQAVVEQTLLINGFTSGEYQVLETGSLLCNRDRKVLGVITDTFGRVKKPMYSVMLGSDCEDLLSELELAVGSIVFYVDEHSPKVFTQPLIGDKGTDASNINDEEIHPDDAEFSDDEKEAEFRRLRKQTKKEGRGTLSRATYKAQHNSYPHVPHTQPSARTPSPPPTPPMTNSLPGFSVPQASLPQPLRAAEPNQTYNVPHEFDNVDAPGKTFNQSLNYDDEPADAELYQPLKRPDNLTQMMAEQDQRKAQALPPWQQRGNRRGGDRGRGSDRGRGGRRSGRGSYNRGGGGYNRGGQHTQYGAHESNSSIPQHSSFPAADQSMPAQYNQGAYHYGNTASNAPFNYGNTDAAASGQQYWSQASANPSAPQWPYSWSAQQQTNATQPPPPPSFDAQAQQNLAAQWQQYYANRQAEQQWQQQHDQWQKQFETGQQDQNNK